MKDLKNLCGTSGTRSICLLVHAYGSSLLLLPGAPTDGHAVCDDVLQYLLDLTTKLKLNNIKLRFQVLTALQLKLHKSSKACRCNFKQVNANNTATDQQDL